jgi:hypothetical protein
MSWKLAELRWRQDVGLHDSCWERENGAIQNQARQRSSTEACPPEDRGRRRHNPPPWCYVKDEKNQTAPISTALPADGIRSDRGSSTFSPTTSVSSTVPLLKFTQRSTDTLLAHSRPAHHVDGGLETSHESSCILETSVESSSLWTTTPLPPQSKACEKDPLSPQGMLAPTLYIWHSVDIVKRQTVPDKTSCLRGSSLLWTEM